MIEQITGLPGSGKTLITLVRVKELAEKENRQVYYNGIPDLKLPWIELDDGAEWWKVPPGSIVVIDEAQRVFRPRGNGAQVPEHVSKLETHRHNGIDLFLITQHPMLLDTNVRRLVGRHLHTVRAFGAKFATLHEWPQVKENCDKSRADSIEHKWFYPKVAFDWYKSAEVHTHKRRIPMRLVVLLFLPLLLALITYYGYTWFKNSDARTKESIEKATGIQAKAPPALPIQPVAASTNYFDAQVPRITGLAHTAPVYDEITKPVRAPYPAACIDWSDRGCRCYTDQSTRLDVPVNLCQQIATTGFYLAWETDRNHRSENRRQTQEIKIENTGDLTPRGGSISAPPALTLSPSPKPDGGGSSTNPRLNPPFL